MPVHEIINALPGVESLTYLELGVDQRNTFNLVRCRRKVGVDWRIPTKFEGVEISVEWAHTFGMSTREFFGLWTSDALFDLIYIDASHNFIDVRDDYNDAVRVLAPRGLIFLHDLVPPDEAATTPGRCGDAWRWLYCALNMPLSWGPKVFVLDGDFGLTLVHGAKSFHPNLEVAGEADFQADFCNDMADVQRLTLDEMIAIARSVQHGER